ncbi:MAG: chloride channel protein [Tissierellia bacterium]|nr:chloride channel protein [Tissierellia bacterium]
MLKKINSIKFFFFSIIIAYAYKLSLSYMSLCRNFLLNNRVIFLLSLILTFIVIEKIKMKKSKDRKSGVLKEFIHGSLAGFLGISIGKFGISGDFSTYLTDKLYKYNISMNNFITFGYNLPISGMVYSIEDKKNFEKRSIVFKIILAAILSTLIHFLLLKHDYSGYLNVNFEKINIFALVSMIIFAEIYYFLFTFLLSNFEKIYQKINLNILFLIVTILALLFFPIITQSGFSQRDGLNDFKSIPILLAIFILKLVYSVFSNTNNRIGGYFSPTIFLSFCMGLIFGKFFGISNLFAISVMTVSLITLYTHKPIFAAFVGFELYLKVNILELLIIAIIIEYINKKLVKLTQKNL